MVKRPKLIIQDRRDIMDVNVKTETEKLQADLQKLISQIQGLDQQKNQLVQQAVEVQGALKLLQRLDGKQEAKQN